MQNEAPKKPLTLCATHGLRFDPALDSGCVLCRKMQAQRRASDSGSRRHWPFMLALVAVLGAGVLVFRALKTAREAATEQQEALARLRVPSPLEEMVKLKPNEMPTSTPVEAYEGLDPAVAGDPKKAGHKTMHGAASSGSGIAVQRLLKAGADINDAGTNVSGETPLKLAIENFHQPLALWMIEKGADARLGDPLLLALRAGMSAAVGPLLKHGADANSGGKEAKPSDDKPIHLAVDKGDIEAADALSRHGAELDAYDRDGLSLLSRACLSKSPRRVHMVLWVIDHLKNRNEVNSQRRLPRALQQYDNFTPIMLAATRYKADATRVLVINGASTYDKEFPLVASVAQTSSGVDGREVDQRDTIQALVEVGADVSEALKFMAENPQLNDYQPWAQEDYIRANVGKRTNTISSFVDDGGNSHLHWAAALGSPSLIKRLLERDMEVQRRSEGPGKLSLGYGAGATPLHVAAAFGHSDAVDVLLAAGAKATQTDTLGRAPKDVACSKSSARYPEYGDVDHAARCERVKASLGAAAAAPTL